MSEAFEKMLVASIAHESGPVGSALFAIHATEFAAGYRDCLIEALKAIREPTPEIIAAMTREIGPLGIMWAAAIDAILEDAK